jgi:hypothetical protein
MAEVADLKVAMPQLEDKAKAAEVLAARPGVS